MRWPELTVHDATKPPGWLVFGSLLAVVIVSLNQYQLFYQLHDNFGQELIDVAHGVLHGRPPWRAFQARLLGPLAFTEFEGSMRWVHANAPEFYTLFERVFSLPDTRPLAVFNAFAAGMILANNIVCFILLLRGTGSPVTAAAGALLGAVLFVMLSDHWIYTWDLFEILSFLFSHT